MQKGDILIAYNELVKLVRSVRTGLIKRYSDQYSFIGVLHGYMDYTYFYYSNDFLNSKKLKLGIVLNLVEMRFEVWLLGNTIAVQEQYWLLTRYSKWSENRIEKPKYSIFEVVVIDNPDFDNLDDF